MNIPKHVLEHEAAFADANYLPWATRLDINPTMFQCYSAPRKDWDWRQRAASLLGDLQNVSLLDMGCGMGEETVYFAKLGARVTAIDISPVGLEIAAKRLVHNNLSDRATVRKMEAQNTDFPSATFDVVHGLGILHHVGLDAGLAEVVRVLKPGGKGVFLEPLGDSKLVETIKRRLYGTQYPKMATDYEEPLKLTELRSWQNKVKVFQVFPYHLLFRLRNKWNGLFHRASIQMVDYYLLKAIPQLAHFAGGAVIYLET